MPDFPARISNCIFSYCYFAWVIARFCFGRTSLFLCYVSYNCNATGKQLQLLSLNFQKWLWNHATKFTRWQHPATGHRMRFPMPITLACNNILLRVLMSRCISTLVIPVCAVHNRTVFLLRRKGIAGSLYMFSDSNISQCN